MALRLAFMGSPAFSVPVFEALRTAGHTVVAVYAQPPRPAGRGHRETPCPVHAAAAAAGVPVHTPRSLKDPAEQERFRALNLDAAVVVAYGLLLPRPILEAPRFGCLNVHASLLPRWRGAAPIQYAILHGDSATGITIMRMDAGLDTGPMLLWAPLPLDHTSTAAGVHDALSALGARLMPEALARLEAGTLTESPQPAEGATYAPKLDRDAGRLDWTQPAPALDRRVRAMTPWPGTFFTHGDSRLKVLAAEPGPATDQPPGTVLGPPLAVACGDGTSLRLTRLQRPGRAAQDAEAFLRGHALPARLDTGDAP